MNYLQEVVTILRVISGTARGHHLKTPKGMSTRPTTDRVKESLFNIISMFIVDSDVLDLFSGSGSLGIEALSRGAASAVFVDSSRECYGIIKDNLQHTKLSDKGKVYTEAVNEAIRKLFVHNKKFDLIFMDPPYSKNLVEETLNCIANNDIIKSNSLIICEHRSSDPVPEAVGRLVITRKQQYGDTTVSFYKCCN